MIPPATRLSEVSISLIREIQALATPLSINLGLGEPDLEPDKWLRDLAATVARDNSWRYSTNAGSFDLRRTIAEQEAPLYDPLKEICITAGTEEALYAVFQAYVGPGDDVLVPDPGFLSYPALTRLAGANPIPYPLDPEEWDVDLTALEESWTENTRAIVVNSPSNPTGGVLSEESVRRLVAMAEERNALVISDEVYREIHYGPSPPSFMGRGRNVVVVNGLSKSHGMTGLRIGWVLAPEALMLPIVTAHQYIATCASVFSQDLANLVIADGEANQAWLDGVRARFAEQREAALRAAQQALGVEVVPPKGGFYLFVPIPACNSVQLAKALVLDAAVVTIPGAAFGKKGEGFLRVSYAAEPDLIRRGIERIGEHLGRV
jgi:aspartate aminotransferase